MTQPTQIQLAHICTGVVAPMVFSGGGPARTVMTGIRKGPTKHNDVFVGRLGLEGDEQADPSVHGGLDKALYAYPIEHWPLWAKATSQDPTQWQPGRLGENLCTQGATEDLVFVGDLWHQGDTVLRVTSPRIPCFKLSTVLKMPTAGKWMYQHHACGWYLAVVVPGILRHGTAFEIEKGPRDTSIAKALQQTRRPSDN